MRRLLAKNAVAPILAALAISTSQSCAQNPPAASSPAANAPPASSPSTVAPSDSSVGAPAPGGSSHAAVDSSQSTQFVARYLGTLLPPPTKSPYRRPSGVTTDFQGNVFVVDTGNHRVLHFDRTGRYVIDFGGYGWNEGELSSPTDASAREGFRLFIADAGNDRIVQYDISDLSAEGAVFPFQEGNGLAGEQLVRPSRLDIDDEGRVYVSDALCHCIWIFTPTGELVNRLGNLGDEPSRFREPAGVAVGNKGRVLVADSGNRRVQVFDPLGNWIASWGGPNEDLFVEPSGIDVDLEGRVYIADRGAARVSVFTPEGRRIFAFGGKGNGPGTFEDPVDIAVAPDGHLYVVDQQRQTVERYRILREGDERDSDEKR
jgi:sugar lactone lactonase YvrE